MRCRWIWVATIVVEAQDRANAVFNACADAAPECPGVPGGRDQGQLAIVLDDEVVSAPAVNSRDLADDEFVISGGAASGFTQGEAEDLVATLGG
ncbi:MAG: SecDF P1 head subdomain-containing protein [Iamia sp.]